LWGSDCDGTLIVMDWRRDSVYHLALSTMPVGLGRKRRDAGEESHHWKLTSKLERELKYWKGGRTCGMHYFKAV
jgi:hypothetical protein